MQADALSGGFADPATQSAQTFRAVMEAMARPGTIQTVRGGNPPKPLFPATGAVLLTLCDTDTPICLSGEADCAAVREWLAFHTGAPFAGRASCVFALGSWDALLPLSHYPIGTARYPDRSATLIVQLPELRAHGATLAGPGIRESAALSLPDTRAFQDNRRLFPRGLDFILTCGDRLAALPRSTEVR